MTAPDSADGVLTLVSVMCTHRPDGIAPHGWCERRRDEWMRVPRGATEAAIQRVLIRSIENDGTGWRVRGRRLFCPEHADQD